MIIMLKRVLGPACLRACLASHVQRRAVWMTRTVQPQRDIKMNNLLYTYEVKGSIGGIRFCSTTGGEDVHIVQMRGLDPETNEEEIIAFFKPLGIEPTKVNLKCDIAGRVSGFCEVEFATYGDAVIAMHKKNAFIGNRFIRLRHKTQNDDIKGPGLEESADELQQRRNETGNIDRNTFTTGHFVRIKNLPRRITEQNIYALFYPLNVKPVNIQAVYDENGVRTGEYDIEFLSHDDACKIMIKNNTPLGQKYLELTLYSSEHPVPRPTTFTADEIQASKETIRS